MFLSADDNNDSARMSKSFKIILGICAALLAVVVLAMFAFAAGVNIGVEGLGAESSGNASWTPGSAGVSGSVTASSSTGCTGTTYTSRNGTLVFTNNSGEAAVLSFDYQVALNGGTVLIDGNSIGNDGSFTKFLAADETVAVVITSNEANSNATSIDIDNIKLEAETEVVVTFEAASNGSYSVNGSAITSQTQLTFSNSEAVAVSASPAGGYKFVGWYNETTGDYFELTASVSVFFTEDLTVRPVFTQSSTPVFKVGKQMFLDLDEAVSFCESSDESVVVLVSNGTLPAGDYTIPDGVTLLVPFDDAHTVYTNEPGIVYGSHSNPTAYMTLTMADGAAITVEDGGKISVPSKLSATGTGINSWNGTPTGAGGRVVMNGSSSIVLNSGAGLYCYGYISGSGNIIAQPGAVVYEAMQFRCWRGGTATSRMTSGVFPMSQYYIQSIEVPVTFHAGSEEKVYAAINANSQAYTAEATFIGSTGMFRVTEGSITKRYDGARDRLVVDVDGDCSLGNLALVLGSFLNLDTTNFDMPINNNITLIVHSGTITCDLNVALLPGVELIIDENASAKVSAGKSIYVYDKSEWGPYAASGQQLVVVGYSTVNGTTAKRTASSLVDATIDVNGVFEIYGDIYTTESGANIISSQGTGQILFKSAAGTNTITQQATQGGTGGTTITKIDIPITSAKLRHGPNRVVSDEYLETDGAEANTVYTYCAECDAWDAQIHNHSGFTVIWVNWDGTELEVDENVPAETLPTYDGETPEKEGDAQYTYTFIGWTPTVSPVTGDVTYTADFDSTVNFYDVTWVIDGVETTEQYEYGQTPEHEDPVKEPTAQYTYTFIGWTPEIREVTTDATYTAVFTENAVTFTVTFKNYDGEVLLETEVPYGEVPVFTGDEPVKESDGNFAYSFAGWYKTPSACYGPATYVAEFNGVALESAILDEDLKFSTVALSLFNDLSINFNMDSAVLTDAGYTEVFVISTVDNRATLINGIANGAKTTFSYKGISPQYMNTTVYSIIFAVKDNVLYRGNTIEYSIADYCMYFLNDPSGTSDYDKALYALLVDLLEYGANAQRYVDFRADDLANGFLEGDTLLFGNGATVFATESDYATTDPVSDPLADWTDVQVLLDKAFRIRIKFTAADVTGLKIVAESNGKVWTYDAGAFVQDGADVYYVDFAGFNFAQLKDVVSFTVKNADDEAVSSTVSYSAQSYVNFVNENQELFENAIGAEMTLKLTDLANSLMRLGESAKVFIEEAVAAAQAA
ncbi:MAG: hypothetical protein ILO53_02885 [Clostridia bacterium]|nr:hypothetical protein [Clostridia bacterium]